jgi:ribosomal protein S27AE
MCIFQPRLCPQCGAQSVYFQYDSRTGGYETTCGRCGHRERHEPQFDDEGIYCGFKHDVRKGFGLLFFRYTNDHEFYSHSLNTVREVIAESWLQEAPRFKCGLHEQER